MTRTSKRLGLSKETLKDLTVTDLQGVWGGAGTTTVMTRSGGKEQLCSSLYDSCKTVVLATCTVVPDPDPIILPKL